MRSEPEPTPPDPAGTPPASNPPGPNPPANPREVRARTLADRAIGVVDSSIALYRKLFAAWLRTKERLIPTERQRLFGLTIAIGAACGIAAVAFHLSILYVERRTIDPAMEAGSYNWVWLTVLVPAVGALFAGLLLHYVVPNARGSGIPQVKVAYSLKGGRPRLRDSVGKFLVGTIQIGSGSSLGREGPTVQICSGVATSLGRLAGVSDRNIKRLIPVGAAAGIAAAFNAPIAAVTFTIEEIVGTLDHTLLSGVIVAAAIAAVVERSVLGVDPVFQVPHVHGLDSASSLVLYALLGVIAAGLSVVFSRSLLALRGKFRSGNPRARWAHPAVGGLVTGLLAIAALALFRTRGVTGGGYVLLDDALSGRLAFDLLLTIGLMKVVATVFSYGSGGAGGLFAPALFIGGTIGGAIGFLDVAIFGHPHAVVGSFALVGMGAMFAGIIRAPITSILIIFEMTNGYSLILPLMIANMSAYGLSRRLFSPTIYEALLEQDGIKLPEQGTTPADAIDSMPLDDFPTLDRDFVTFYPTLDGTRILRDSATAGRQELFPVIDKDERLVGVVWLEDLTILAAEPLLHDGLVNAADIMRPPVAISHDQPLRAAYEMMLANSVRELPVLDDKGRVIGLIDEVAVAHAYLQARRTSVMARHASSATPPSIPPKPPS